MAWSAPNGKLYMGARRIEAVCMADIKGITP